MSPSEKNIALLGFPRTGKSTYVGALWQVIQDGRDNSIVEVDVRGDRAYLQLLGEQVARAEEVRRTDVDSNERLSLTVRVGDQHDVALEIPDLSGETVRMLVEDRTWHPHLVEAVASADALMLFVHPDRIRMPVTRNEELEALQHVGVPLDLDDGDGTDAGRRYAPKDACTAAGLVDLLENVAEEVRTWPIAVAVVVSAWDEIEGDYTPQQWLEARLPAIAAWCRANDDRVRTTVFGVSAIGGRLPDERMELLDRGQVLDRCYAHEANGARVSLSEVISWVLEIQPDD